MSSLTWPKQKRLVRRAEYQLCYRLGRRYFTRNFIVFVLPGLQGGTRVGLAVTRKNGNAAERNRIKRVLREFFRLHQLELPDVHIVVTPKKNMQVEHLGLHKATTELLPFFQGLSAA